MSKPDDGKPAPRGPHRWAKGERHPQGRRWQKGEVTSHGAYGSLALQRRLEGKGGQRALQQQFRRRSVAVMHALKRVILDPTAPPAVKVEAVRLFLEYGWGKPEAPAAKAEKAKKPEPIVIVSRVPRPPKTGDL